MLFSCYSILSLSSMRSYGQQGERRFVFTPSSKTTPKSPGWGQTMEQKIYDVSNEKISVKNLPDCVEYTRRLILNPDRYYNQFMKDFKFDKRKAVTPDAPDGYYLRRYTCVFGDPDILEKPPSIWGIDNPIMTWTPELLEVKNLVESKTGKKYNTALCNLYKKGTDMINWHCDMEERGSTSSIGSVSFGAERDFLIRSLTDPSELYKIKLENGSLLEMKDPCQSLYQHCLPEDPKLFKPRLNITFRYFDSERYANH